MAHFGSIQMGILIRPSSLHTDLPMFIIFFYVMFFSSCFKSSDLFFWLNPLAFLLFSSAFNSFIVIFEEFRIIRACGFWKGSFTWLSVRVTCMPFLSAFFNVLIPLSVVSLFISMSLSLSWFHSFGYCWRTSPAESHLMDFRRITLRATSLFLYTTWPVKIFTDL